MKLPTAEELENVRIKYKKDTISEITETLPGIIVTDALIGITVTEYDISYIHDRTIIDEIISELNDNGYEILSRSNYILKFKHPGVTK